MELTASILAGLLALAFLGAGGAKLAGADQMVASLRDLGVGEGLQRAIGVLEVARPACADLRRTAVAGVSRWSGPNLVREVRA